MALAAVGLDDWRWIASALPEWLPSFRWSLGPRTPSPGHVIDLLSSKVVEQRAVVDADGHRVAVLQVTGLDSSNQFAYLDVLCDPDARDTTRACLASFVADSFERLALRKMCAMAYEGELDLGSYLGELARPAGRLEDHGWRDGKPADLVIYEIWGDQCSPTV